MSDKEIYSLTEYVLQNNGQKDAFEMFNEWNDTLTQPIVDFEEAIWFVEYIKLLHNTDPAVIETARKIDKKRRKNARK